MQSGPASGDPREGPPHQRREGCWGLHTCLITAAWLRQSSWEHNLGVCSGSTDDTLWKLAVCKVLARLLLLKCQIPMLHIIAKRLTQPLAVRGGGAVPGLRRDSSDAGPEVCTRGPDLFLSFLHAEFSIFIEHLVFLSRNSVNCLGWLRRPEDSSWKAFPPHSPGHPSIVCYVLV
uniref:Uncharacterized protein n=1 Tax=Rhinopithecus roxellana TaxID=61622 RepID=A0A2K6NZ21_RHIRO